MDVGTARVYFGDESDQVYDDLEILENGWIRVPENRDGQTDPGDTYYPPTVVEKIDSDLT